MAKIAMILPIPVEFRPNERTISNALAEIGKMRYLGTGVRSVPIKEASGKYLTGLDPDATYIRKMIDPEAKQREIAIVTERRDRLQNETGMDLSPRAEYYSGVYGLKCGTNEVANAVKLIDGQNTFNFSNPLREIEYWWVIQNKRLIASSLESRNAGHELPEVQFYISNPDEEASLIYSVNKLKSDQIVKLGSMSLERRLKVARLLGLPVQDNDKEEIVYNALYNFIELKTIKIGIFQGQDPVKLFQKIANMKDQLLDVSEMVDRSIKLRVYNTKGLGGPVYEGDTLVSNSKEELITSLCLGSKEAQQEYMALKLKIGDKIKLKSI